MSCQTPQRVENKDPILLSHSDIFGEILKAISCQKKWKMFTQRTKTFSVYFWVLLRKVIPGHPPLPPHMVLNKPTVQPDFLNHLIQKGPNLNSEMRVNIPHRTGKLQEPQPNVKCQNQTIEPGQLVKQGDNFTVSLNLFLPDKFGLCGSLFKACLAAYILS